MMQSVVHWFRFTREEIVVITLLLITLAAFASVQGPSDVVGNVQWPGQWVVFGPLERGDPILPAEVLQTIPETIQIAPRYGGVEAEAKMLTGKKVKLEGTKFDFASIFNGDGVGTTGYAFSRLVAAADGPVTLGFGADWWLQAWVDGELIVDTTSSGNVVWPPDITNFPINVDLTKGPHVLAIRFIRGVGSAVLTVGGPSQLREVPKLVWKTVDFVATEMGENVVPNGNFEQGGEGDPWIPNGWTNGPGQVGYLEGEIAAAREHAMEGDCSLRINTMGKATKRRILYTRLSLRPMQLYRITYKPYHVAGGKVQIMLREKPTAGPTYFLQGGLISPSRTSDYEGYYFVENPRPYLVIQSDEPTDVVIDGIDIRLSLDKSKMWSNRREQRVGWCEGWYQVSDEVITPHVKWARPYAGGQVRLLSIMPRWGQRRTCELAQRLDCECQVVMMAGRGYSAPGKGDLGGSYWIQDSEGQLHLFDPEADALDKIAQQPDCILLSETAPGALSEQVIRRMLAQVARGCGLVIDASLLNQAHQDGYQSSVWAEAIKPENKTDEDVDYVALGPIAKPHAEFYRYGQGRIALVRAYLPDDKLSLSERFEYECGYTIKVVLWASQRLPTARITTVDLPGESAGLLRSSVEREALPSSAIVQLHYEQPTPQDMQLDFWITDCFGQKAHEQQKLLPAGETSAVLRVPKLSAGAHFLNLQVKRSNKIVDWTTAMVAVEADPALEKIELTEQQRPYYIRGERVHGRITLSSPLDEAQSLLVELIDADGRIWHRGHLTGPGTEFEFEFSTTYTVVLAHSIRATVSDADGVISQAEQEFAVVPTSRWSSENFDFGIWQAHGGNYISWLMQKALREQFGITNCVFVGGLPNATTHTLARNNIRVICPAANAYDPGKATGDLVHAPVREKCLTSDSMRGWVANRTKAYSSRVKWGPLAYILNHEYNLFRSRKGIDICFSPTCIEDLRRWVQDEYGSLADLNRSWGTSFTRWDEVRPITLPDAIQQDQIPRWVDHRRHMDRVFTNFSRYKVDCMRRYDPLARGVADNLHAGPADLDSYTGVDYWQLLNEVIGGAALPYPYLTSFVPSGRRHLVWQRSAVWGPNAWTGHPDLLTSRFRNSPWGALLSGASGYNYWAYIWGADPNNNFQTPVLPDLRTTHMGRTVAEGVAQIRTGLDRLIFQSERDDSGIALHYSRSSEHVCTAWQTIQDTEEARALDPCKSRFAFFAPALQVARRSFSALAYGQIENGQLTTKDYKLLILPFSQALSAQEAGAIRQFVAAGGRVLADIRPGMTNEHSKAGQTGLLDEVFGVRHRPGLASYRPRSADISSKVALGNEELALNLQGAILGPELQLTDGQALGHSGQIPLLITNRYDKGRTILLNFSLETIEGQQEQVQALFDAILDYCGIEPLCDTQVLEAYWNAADEKVPAPSDYFGAAAVPQLARFVNGNIDILGLWYHDRGRGLGQQRMLLKLHRGGHVYDLKTNEYLGDGDEFEISLPLEGLRAYAVVPYKIPRPKLTTRAQHFPDQRTSLNCRAELPSPAAHAETHVIQFRLLDPDGREWKDFRANAVSNDGVARHRFVLPCNAPSGSWTVVAREAISGLAAEQVWQKE